MPSSSSVLRTQSPLDDDAEAEQVQSASRTRPDLSHPHTQHLHIDGDNAQHSESSTGLDGASDEEERQLQADQASDGNLDGLEVAATAETIHADAGAHKPRASRVTATADGEDKKLSRRMRSHDSSKFDWSTDARPFAIFLAVAAGSALLWRLLKNKRSRRKDRSQGGNSRTVKIPGQFPISETLLLPCLPESGIPGEARPLRNATFVAADLFNIYVPPDQRDAIGPRGSCDAPVLMALRAAGATCVGTALTPEHNLGLLGDVAQMACNPLAPQYVSGGVGGGCASAVSAGHADIGIGTDHLAGIRVAAACCGIFGFRATHDAVSTEGVSLVCPSLEAVSFTALAADIMHLVGTSLQLPGGSASLKSEVVRILVCKDLFQGCDDQMAAALTAFQSAAKSWAGDDLVNQIPIMKVLADIVPSLESFRGAEDSSVLDAMVDAAEALQVSHVEERHPEYIASVEKVGDETLAAARQVAAECRMAVRRACANGMILAMPTLPGPPPRRNAEEADLHKFEDRTLQLTALAALSGAPVAVIPVPVPDGPPLSISLLGLPKTDMRLLQVALKLTPLIAAATAPRKNEAAGKNSSASAKLHPMHLTPEEAADAAAIKRQHGEAGSEVPGQKQKDRGNAAFKAGDYRGAIQAYSEAIRADTRNPVYYSNRAMAALKVMEFRQAESDCTAALNFEGPRPQVKTLLRRGTARLGLHKIAAARADFTQVTNLEPSNRQAREELRMLQGMEDFDTEPDSMGNHYSIDSGF